MCCAYDFPSSVCIVQYRTSTNTISFGSITRYGRFSYSSSAVRFSERCRALCWISFSTLTSVPWYTVVLIFSYSRLHVLVVRHSIFYFSRFGGNLVVRYHWLSAADFSHTRTKNNILITPKPNKNRRQTIFPYLAFISSAKTYSHTNKWARALTRSYIHKHRIASWQWHFTIQRSIDSVVVRFILFFLFFVASPSSSSSVVGAIELDVCLGIGLNRESTTHTHIHLRTHKDIYIRYKTGKYVEIEFHLSVAFQTEHKLCYYTALNERESR